MFTEEGQLMHHGLPCEDCGSSDALAEYTINYYCFSCHKYTPKSARDTIEPLYTDGPDPGSNAQLPDDITYDLPRKALAWLYKNRVFGDLIDKYRIGYSENCWMWSKRTQSMFNSGSRVILPYYDEEQLVFYEARSLQEGDKLKYLTSGKKKDLFKTFVGKQRKVVIVEDIISAMRVGEVMPTVALRGTSFNDDKLLRILETGDSFVIWLDGDAAGKSAAIKLKNKLSWTKPVDSVFTHADPKCYDDDEIRAILALDFNMRT